MLQRKEIAPVFGIFNLRNFRVNKMFSCALTVWDPVVYFITGEPIKWQLHFRGFSTVSGPPPPPHPFIQ